MSMAATKVFPLPVSITAIVFSLSAFSYIWIWYDRGTSSGSCISDTSTRDEVGVGGTSIVDDTGAGTDMSAICSCTGGDASGVGRVIVDRVVFAGFDGGGGMGLVDAGDIGFRLTGGVIIDDSFSGIGEYTGSRLNSDVFRGSSFLGTMGSPGIIGEAIGIIGVTIGVIGEATGAGASVGWRIGAFRQGMESSHKRWPPVTGRLSADTEKSKGPSSRDKENALDGGEARFGAGCESSSSSK